MHESHVSCLYKVLWFKRSTTVGEHYHMFRQDDNRTKSDGLGQIIVDNIDAELSIRIGRVSTHDLATIETNVKKPTHVVLDVMYTSFPQGLHVIVHSFWERRWIIPYISSPRKATPATYNWSILVPKQRQGSHVCASWSSFCGSKHSVHHDAELDVYLQHWLRYYKWRDLVGSQIT